jgi:hypothetical protein
LFCFYLGWRFEVLAPWTGFGPEISQDALDLPHRPLKSSAAVSELLEETINRSWPFLFFMERRLNIAQTPAISCSLPF